MMKKELPDGLELCWVSDPGHGWLEITGDEETARRCATGYDYARGATIYLEEDVSAGAYFAYYGLSAGEVRSLGINEREFSPRHLTHVAAGDIGARSEASGFFHCETCETVSTSPVCPDCESITRAIAEADCDLSIVDYLR